MSASAGRPAGRLVRPTGTPGWTRRFLLVLGTAALVGLAGTFTGQQFLVVGIVGLLLGVALALLTTTLRWPVVAPVLLAIGVFYLVGGLLCLRSVGALLPGPDTWRLLTDRALFGWKELLTTLPAGRR